MKIWKKKKVRFSTIFKFLDLNKLNSWPQYTVLSHRRTPHFLPKSQLSPIIRQRLTEENGGYHITRFHMKSANHIFSRCCSCCASRQRNALCGKSYLPSSACTSSQMPVIGYSHYDLLGRDSNATPPIPSHPIQTVWPILLPYLLFLINY